MADTHETPLFVYDEAYFTERIRDFFAVWKRHFSGGEVYLSYKTNYMPRLCRIAHEIGLGADVVSGYELEHAIKLKATDRAVFNGPLKRVTELRRAAIAGVGINVDLKEELVALQHLRDAGDIPEPRLGIRVNPGRAVYASKDPSFITAHQARQGSGKFGWPLDDDLAEHVADTIKQAGFALRMVHTHLNSQITRPELMLDALRPVLAFVRKLVDRGTPIDEVNIGGGFGVSGMVRTKRGWWAELKHVMNEPIPHETAEEFDLESFCSALQSELAAFRLESLRVSCEPGRFLFSPSCALLTRVVGIKHLRSKTWLIVDAGLHIMPTASFGEKRRLRFLSPDKGEMHAGDDAMECALGGPLCYEGDVLMHEIRAPRDIAAGDLVLISDAGAYTVSRSTNFNQPRAAVAMRDTRDGRLIWRREAYDDIFRYAE
ncbi:diaminopimelate decarboxylase family protein [Sinorhizobium meliloti]|uniref:diaminopimelate decarboxylase family protein n=1 Tax=Rhizobium meliloti TaxID=382 RepID=UPI0013E40656|nr:hypothetical protein [Sinorhizobium meliloti]